jgi:hypothetical protein
VTRSLAPTPGGSRTVDDVSLIEREALIRAATDWVEAVLEHGDPAMRSGARDFAAVVDDVLAQRPPGAVAEIERLRGVLAVIAASRAAERGWFAQAALDAPRLDRAGGQ